MKTIRIQPQRFDTGAELAPLRALGGGAVASFTGIARSDPDARGDVTMIQLEHYPAMTSSALNELMDAAYGKWELLGCVLIHRVGEIFTGEEIVLVGAASLHRADALSAVAFLIDRLKTDIPLWKKEYRSDGSARWVDEKLSDIRVRTY
jgi:molybdopterin synthase catalytic subunit